MAEGSNEVNEVALHAKRKPDLVSADEDILVRDEDNKKQKVEISSDDASAVVKADRIAKRQVEEDDNDDDDNDDDDDEEEEDYHAEEDYDDEDDEGDDEHSNGESQMDVKGKSIMKDVKGKGKLIEESEDSSDGESESDGDSDLSDDPLAEVDLDNILPSRTRRRPVPPGIRISNDLGKGRDGGDSDDIA